MKVAMLGSWAAIAATPGASPFRGLGQALAVGRRVAALEGGVAALLVASGQAAETIALSVIRTP